MSTNILIDSSAWIEFFRGNEQFAFISDILLAGQARINELILLELLPSMQMKKEEKLINLMHKIRLCSMEIDWNELKEFQVANLQNGNNKVPITDLIIAQNCIKNNLEIVTADKHFIKMADYLPLKIYKNSQP